MAIVFLTPPLTKPSEPGLSAAAAARAIQRAGLDAHWVDASMGWHDHVLGYPASIRALQHPNTYRDRHVYSSAVTSLEQSLKAAATPFPGLRLGVAMIGWDGKRVESRETLRTFSAHPGPFDDYVTERLIPSLDTFGATHVGLSLTFQQQAPAAFRMARLLAEHRPALRRWLGGPLVSCWMAAGFDLTGAPFDTCHRIVSGTQEDLMALAQEAFPGCEPRFQDEPWSPNLNEAPWDKYLSPSPVVPAAVGRGCYFGRCTFCPDHLHPHHTPCSHDRLAAWLAEVASRFPRRAMVHFTDSAVPPAFLETIANTIRNHRLPISWHAFVRIEERLADPTFTHHLKEGGCAMLQLGVETGSPRLLQRMGKGTDPPQILRVLQGTAAAGIRNQVYLLFGLPTETGDDREMTLSLVEAARTSILAVNAALLNLPLGSPMQRRPESFGITEMFPFGPGADLALYTDFRCGPSHPRSEARRWLNQRFFKHPAVREVRRHLRSPFKANHLCFLEDA